MSWQILTQVIDARQHELRAERRPRSWKHILGRQR
jgi:hypothetical protein